MQERPTSQNKPEFKNPWNLTIPPDIVNHLASITESQNHEDLRKVFQFILAIGERVVEKIWATNDGQLIYRIGGKEEVIYDGYTRSFGDAENSTPDEEDEE